MERQNGVAVFPPRRPSAGVVTCQLSATIISRPLFSGKGGGVSYHDGLCGTTAPCCLGV